MHFLDNQGILFADRLKILRKEYRLTTAQMAVLLGFKRQSSISNFESKRGYPSFEALIRIMLTFGVSIHWLIGYSDAEYENDLLLRIEKVSPDINKSWGITVPHEYLDDILRTENYSLKVRANIIFLRNVLSSDTDTFEEKREAYLGRLKSIL